MAYYTIPGFEGKIYFPDENNNEFKKYDCQDCFSCQMCSDDRCATCLKKNSCKKKIVCTDESLNQYKFHYYGRIACWRGKVNEQKYNLFPKRRKDN
jgi:hypothetical protein